MDHINKYFRQNPRYTKLQKPLEAAGICDAARELSKGRFEVTSYNEGVLCLAVPSSAEAANLQAESSQIIESINKKLGKEMVKRIRYKIQS